MQLGNSLPVFLVDTAGIGIAVIIVLSIVYKFWSWKKVLPPNFFNDSKRAFGGSTLISVFLSELVNRVILFRDVIVDSKKRRLAHYFVFWGFIGTGIATTLDYVYNREAVGSFLPAIVFGNVGGILLLIGGTLVLIRRYSVKERILTARTETITKSLTVKDRLVLDSSFLWLLYLATITGFTAEAGGLTDNIQIASVNYIIHLVIVAALLVTAPFTHFFHAILEPIMRYIGRFQTMLSSRIGVSYKHVVMTNEMLKEFDQSKKQQ